MKAEITQLKLRLSSEEVQSEYARQIMDFVNKSYDDEMVAKSDFTTVLGFVRQCELTGDEFMIALNLASSQDLTDVHGEKIKYFRDINVGNFNLYASAYIEYRNNFKPYQLGKDAISEFLKPPPLELTPEQKKQERILFLKAEFKRLQSGNNVLGANIFYELIKKKGLTKVNIKFIEGVLEKFVPETSLMGIITAKGNEPILIPKKIKNDVKVFFEDQLVSKFIKSEKLHELSEDKWIEYWQKIEN